MKKLISALLILTSSLAIAHDFKTGDSFECLGTETKNLYNVEIIDIGDEEGTVVINDGGAPVRYEAYYHHGSFFYGVENQIQLKQLGYWRWDEAMIKHDGIVEYAACIRLVE